MKVARIKNDITFVFPSITIAALDAGMGRHKFSRRMHSQGRIKREGCTYVFPRN